jgi:type VI secretion system protein ImpG
MADELLPYYEKELAFIRQMGAEFAEEHPKIAGRLGINADTIEDPHVSRLIESFAYLNARIQHKLDDDFPELSDALLGVLFPHYQRPIPSMSIVQFVPDRDQLAAAYTVARHTLLETEPFQGETCKFSTVYPAELLPVTLTTATLMGRPFTTPGSAKMRGAGGVLKLSLATFNDDISFAELKPDRLRFYLKGQPQYINPLYHLLMGKCVDVVLTTGEDDTQPVHLGPGAIQPVGFDPNDGLLPYPPSSFMGYRLLTEFFVFPEKFMFIELCGLAGKISGRAAAKLEFYIYLESSDVELEHYVSEQSFLLGCTPVVNLFKHRADPIRLDQTQMEYQIVPDARRPKGYEVYSVDNVTASTPLGDPVEYRPLYGLDHAHQESESHAYWIAARRHAKLSAFERDDGTDVFLNLVDLRFNPNIPEDRVLTLETTCSNRDLPAKLPFNIDQPKLQCVEGAPPCSRIRCITQPSPVVRPPLRNQARWRLISHLSLNHLSLTGRDNATEALREVLRLYDFKESSVSRALIESIHRVTAHPISAPMSIDGHAMMCRGFEVEIELDDMLLSGSSSYLFASILEHFFALYCSINSFTRVLVRLRNKEGYLKKCPPRAGEKVLL